MSDLKPCPCGQTPKRLHIYQGNCSKYAFAYGSCCGEWHIEFRTDYKELDSPECMKLAIQAWDATPRATDKTVRADYYDIIVRFPSKEVADEFCDQMCDGFGEDFCDFKWHRLKPGCTGKQRNDYERVYEDGKGVFFVNEVFEPGR